MTAPVRRPAPRRRARVLLAAPLLAAPLLAMLAGCASYPANSPFGTEGGPDVPPAPEVSYNFQDLPASPGGENERLFVIVTFSGGGTRAAALAYGVLDTLRRVEVASDDGGRRRLIDEIDTISSISGGSYTAGFYGLEHDGTFDPGPDGFRRRFLYRDYQDELIGLVLSPLNWPRLASADFGRGDLAAEYLSETVFDDKTYDALFRAGRPFVVVNATDIAKGTPFHFTQKQFDLLCSDLSDVPVARAVMASSDFPGAFSALTVNNYATCVEAVKRPGWIDDAYSRDTYELNRQFYRRGKVAESYSLPEAGSADGGLEREFIHLIDGGVADNLGLRPMLEAVETPIGAPNLLEMINDGLIDRIVVIAVNARGETRNDWDREAAPPGLFDTVLAAAYNPIDQVTFDSLGALEELMEAFNRDRGAEGLDPVDFHSVPLEFEQLPADLRSCFYDIATSLQLPADQVDALIAVAPRLLRDSPAFAEVLDALDGGPLPEPDMAAIRKACE